MAFVSFHNNPFISSDIFYYSLKLTRENKIGNKGIIFLADGISTLKDLYDFKLTLGY